MSHFRTRTVISRVTRSATCPYFELDKSGPLTGNTHTSLRSIVMLLIHLRQVFQVDFFFSFPHRNPVCISVFLQACYVLLPAHPPWFYQRKARNVWCGVQIVKIPIMQFSPYSYYWLPHKPAFLPQYPILEHAQPMISPYVSRLCTTIGKIRAFIHLRYLLLYVV